MSPRTGNYDHVLAAIRKYQRDHRVAPSLRELMTLTGISALSTVKYALDRLEEAGSIRREPGKARSIQIGRFTPVKKNRKVSATKLTDVPCKTKKRDILQERIEMVVKKALQFESKTNYDVIRHVNERLRFTNARKIG